jgi:hypothetical protein
VEFDDAAMTLKPGPATLDVGGKVESLTRADEPPADAGYSCLK